MPYCMDNAAEIVKTARLGRLVLVPKQDELALHRRLDHQQADRLGRTDGRGSKAMQWQL